MGLGLTNKFGGAGFFILHKKFKAYRSEWTCDSVAAQLHPLPPLEVSRT